MPQETTRFFLSSPIKQFKGDATVTIDNLMKDALRIGAPNNKQVIDSEVILAAVENRK